MENRFKFRCWNKDKKELMEIDDIFNLHFEEKERWCVVINELSLYCNYLNGELMQSTGLKDKNEKLVFEGDIVKVGEEGRNPHKVVFSNEDAAFLVERRKLDGELECAEFFDSRGYEVIGNIYENPELLNPKE